LVMAALAFAFGVLFVSVFRTASTKYQFNPVKPADVANVLGNIPSKIKYPLPYPGKVLPDNLLWPIKAMRDKLWFFVNTNPTKQAELTLLFADKRLGSAKLLIDKGKLELGVTTLTKSEKYLEEAYSLEKRNEEEGFDTSEFLVKLANASLKHYEVIEYILTKVPDNARPAILQTEIYSKNVYVDVRNRMVNSGKTPPENPFAW